MIVAGVALMLVLVLVVQAFILFAISSISTQQQNQALAHTQLWDTYKGALHLLSERAKRAEEANTSIAALAQSATAAAEALKARDEEVRFLRTLVNPQASSTAFLRGNQHVNAPAVFPSDPGRWGFRETSSFMAPPDLGELPAEAEPIKS